MCIGTATPTLAPLVVHGISGAGRTAGIFGDGQGISLQRNIPAIGFNQYRDDSLNNNNGRYLGSGYAALLSYSQNDLNKGLELNIYPFGSTNSPIPTGIRPLRIASSGNTPKISIMTDGDATLDVGRSTGSEGTAMFQGTNYHSHFNYSTSENTYIRPGKSYNVYINDIPGGKVVFGGSASRVGVNTSTPVYPLEIRQVAGTGLRLARTTNTGNNAWEWRVAGSPANFYLYYSGGAVTHISPVDGSLHPISDGRLKTNIRTISPVINKILKLNPVSYEMVNDNPGNIRSIGFIAQEVFPLFPELTGEGKKQQDTMSLQYSGFNIIAIKGIQEEQELIVQLEQQATEVENRMLEMEKKIALRSKRKLDVK